LKIIIYVHEFEGIKSDSGGLLEVISGIWRIKRYILWLRGISWA